jgi:hypothetical protein
MESHRRRKGKYFKDSTFRKGGKRKSLVHLYTGCAFGAAKNVFLDNALKKLVV